jgi:hypothetical protein
MPITGHPNPSKTWGHGMKLPDAPIAHEGFFATHFFTVSDQDKSKDFYVRILGGKVIKSDNPCYIKLANTWIILNSGGGPTPDKPEVILETPSDRNIINSFLNLRVADIQEWFRDFAVNPERCENIPGYINISRDQSDNTSDNQTHGLLPLCPPTLVFRRGQPFGM